MAEATVGQKLGNLVQAVASFESMADLVTHEERKKALLKKCDEVWHIAAAGRISQRGKEIPDCAAMNKTIELAARLLGVMAEAEKRAKDGEGETSKADIEYIAGLLRSAGYDVKKAA